ncbi:hypothetical protein RINTHH_1100 [Richelia intracellularis HH01]|uniref:Uncharacterized protein n=1 Tax=Richelia intracellularis HH01 TaxID=1165094 RepID=M1X261_9NOST|nr:hypothetical protein RINTHH_1100 [Richelia intracellularis HH01]
MWVVASKQRNIQFVWGDWATNSIPNLLIPAFSANNSV